MSKLFVNVVKEALENLSGKKLPDKGYTELADVYSDFNDLYTCEVGFKIVTDIPGAATNVKIDVRDSKGGKMHADENDKYHLKAGNYTYNVIAPGFVPQTNQPLVISDSDVTDGTKIVTVKLNPRN